MRPGRVGLGAEPLVGYGRPQKHHGHSTASHSPWTASWCGPCNCFEKAMRQRDPGQESAVRFACQCFSCPWQYADIPRPSPWDVRLRSVVCAVIFKVTQVCHGWENAHGWRFRRILRSANKSPPRHGCQSAAGAEEQLTETHRDDVSRVGGTASRILFNFDCWNGCSRIGPLMSFVTLCHP